MPECSEIGLMLGAAGDGELEPNSMQEIAHHLTGCAACAVQLSDYSRIGRELRAIATMPSLEGFTKSVLAAITAVIAVAMFALALHINTNTPTVARAVPEAVTAKAAAPSSAAAPIRVFDVRVDSAVVADQTTGAFTHASGWTQSGKMIVFNLAGGKTLHIEPRAIDGDMIKMEVVLFEGSRATMTVDLNLASGSTLALGGEQFAEGTLLLRISPTAAKPISALPRLL